MCECGLRSASGFDISGQDLGSVGVRIRPPWKRDLWVKGKEFERAICCPHVYTLAQHTHTHCFSHANAHSLSLSLSLSLICIHFYTPTPLLYLRCTYAHTQHKRACTIRMMSTHLHRRTHIRAPLFSLYSHAYISTPLLLSLSLSLSLSISLSLPLYL